MTVQEQYIPKALFGLDVLCETGTAAENRIVYILTTLQKLIPTEESNVMVICESHEATLRVLEDYNNLSKSMPNVKIATFTSASTIQSDADKLRAKAPNIVIGTAERVFELLDAKILSSENTKQLILDECHSMLEQPGQYKKLNCFCRIVSAHNVRLTVPPIIRIWIDVRKMSSSEMSNDKLADEKTIRRNLSINCAKLMEHDS